MQGGRGPCIDRALPMQPCRAWLVILGLSEGGLIFDILEQRPGFSLTAGISLLPGKRLSFAHSSR
jgi:hypothetical protein